MQKKTPRRSTRPFAMIIDDDRDIVALFRHVLDLAGYITEINLRGDKAMERLNSVTPDIVLLDLNLAGVSGIDIIDKIRSDARLMNTSVIIVTGYPEMIVGKQTKADLILQKPVSIDQLSNLLKRFQKIDPEAVNDHPYDETTQLYNQNFFMQRLSHSIEHLNRFSGDLVGILFVDCDNFNLVQQQGKQFANQILAKTAEVLKTAVRPYDTIAHFSSGQFFIQIEDLPTKDILYRIAERVHNNLTSRIFDTYGFEMTANIGMVFCSSDYSNAEEIIRDADIAMFYAKSNPFTDLVNFNPIKHGAFRSEEKYTAIARASSPDREST